MPTRETEAVVDEYKRRLDERRSSLERLRRRDRLVANLRLAAALAAVLLAWLAFGPRALSPAWLGLAAVLFVALVRLHHRVVDRRIAFERATRFYEAGLARLVDRWAGDGTRGERFRSEEHPYAEDLDLFGEGSVFELLCRARTSTGEDRLAAWLTAPATVPEIEARQAAVRELGPMLDLREELAVLAEEVRGDTEPDELRAWGHEPPPAPTPAVRVTAAAFACATVVTLVLANAGPLAPIVPIAVIAAQWIFARIQRDRVRAALDAARRPCHDLELLAAMLERLASDRFESPRLCELHTALETGGLAPHHRLRRLRRLTDLLDARLNPFFAPFGALLLWTTQLTFALEAWRAKYGSALERWMDVVGEFEALASLACHRHENPDDVFPVFAEERARFEADGLGHPLLPRDRCVCNDVGLGTEPAVLLLSGSNMSGKSTLLRTVGVNAVLAQAGAPVRARSMTLSPVSIGASIRAHDSIREGTSRFFAEITRIRSIVELTRGDLPVLFLLDEILQGTNSEDRRVGAEAVVDGLVDKGAIGLITTHDLALTGMVDRLGGRARNVHFQDELIDDRMRFDYRLKEGVVTHSNALALMRAIGLKV